MPIPTNINREHVLQAILKINREGVPNRRSARNWFVRFERRDYPCKLLISWANIYANGEELDPNPSVFISITARTYLENLGFEIIEI